jgi:hypothetical protein
LVAVTPEYRRCRFGTMKSISAAGMVSAGTSSSLYAAPYTQH